MSKTVMTISLKEANPFKLYRRTWSFNPASRPMGKGKYYSRRDGKNEVRRALSEI